MSRRAANSTPDAHVWTKVGRALWRCHYCGGCRRSQKKPDSEAVAQRDALAQYEAISKGKKP